MAAPHVTGAAALLAAYEPNASTLDLKQALLSSVDPVATFDPATGAFPVSSGGRLNADKALTAVDALIAPDTKITSGPSGTVATGSASFAFHQRCQDAGHVRVPGGRWRVQPVHLAVHSQWTCRWRSTASTCARGTSRGGNADPTPASAAWTVAAPAHAAGARRQLADAGKVTGVTVKRAKKSAAIKWKAVPGASSYEVGSARAKRSPRVAPSMKIKKLSPKKKYTVQIMAVNAAGSSPLVTVKVKKFKKK